ncbi:MAG: RNA methyltransferase, partial [Candidatus Delongbacteria bacterium]
MTETVYGNNAILELIENSENKVKNILIERNFKSDKIKRILSICVQKNIKYELVHSLNSYKASGKGAVAFTSDYEYFDLKSSDIEAMNSIVILDGIEDPHNLGAIVRSTAASGFDLVIIPEKRSALVTGSVINVSAGTVYKIRISKVKNIVSCIKDLKKQGFWITGTDMDGRPLFTGYDFTQKAAVVIGSEGKGLRRLVRENCDDIISI